MKTTQFETTETLAKKGACIEFFSAYQDFDIDRMLGLCHPEGTIDFMPLGASGQGKINEVGKAIWSALMKSFPDIDNTVHSQTFHEEANEVHCNVVIFGKQQKDFAGIPSKGLRFDTEHIFIFRFDEQGKIRHIDINWNHESFVKQLGA